METSNTLSDNKEIHEKFAMLQVTIQDINAKNEVKFAKLEDTNTKLQEMINSLHEEFKILKKNDINLIESSHIVKEEEIEQIKKWVDPLNYKKVYFKLLYRASEHGKTAKDFHSRCDNKVTYINNIYTYITGGYYGIHMY